MSIALRKRFISSAANGRPQSNERNELPLRSELFSTDQLEQHAKALAASQQVEVRRGPDHLLNRLEKNEAVLLDAYHLVLAAVAAKRQMSPADEWLLDNFYLIEEQIRTARRHFPKNYSRQLPRLRSGPLAGFPRVYEIALELISHVDGRVTAESLTSFVTAFQSVAPLRLGELWAVPIMLRLALIENLRRVAARMGSARRFRDEADYWADQMFEVAEKDPRNLVLVMAEMTRSAPAMDSEFVAEFARRMQMQSQAMALPLVWLEQRLGEQAVTVEQLMQAEGQQQAADQVSIGNSIGSLRFLGATDWREFVESLSLVEQTLRGYPQSAFGETDLSSRDYRRIIQSQHEDSDVYLDMDFATRDRYRHVIERIAKRSPLSEFEVAAKAVLLAQRSAGLKGERDRSAHVGYYLIDKGLPQLEAETSAKAPLGLKLRRWFGRRPLLVYTSSIGAIAVAVTVLASVYAWQRISPLWLAVAACLVFLAATHLGVAIVNWLVTLFVSPRTLPRMDFSLGVPSEFRTLVAVPTMLTNSAATSELVEALEVRYLANPEDNLHFALLTDWIDAPAETMPGDQELLEQAREGIEALNLKYADKREDLFFLFHRPRRWNAQERVWTGHERKRGKLSDLNKFLRGGASEQFLLIVGPTEHLAAVQYVITLDTDTQLPREVARRLIGAMAHPLNRPYFNARDNVVRDGYGILQPRVSLSLPSARKSWFVRLFGGQAGIDPYTRAISDVYQDLFGEGSFIGKGIYDVDAFERALGERLPQNLILSHDLLEGCYTRSALVSDIALHEPHPSRYSADVSRRHRWIRGDWQIASWIFPSVPAPNRTRVKNPLSPLSRWKIFDNLRRSLVPAALVLLLILSWLTPIWPASFGTLLVLSIMLIPAIVRFSAALIQRPVELSWRLHLRVTASSLGHHVVESACELALLADQACYSLDAVVRTLWRLSISRRNLLQWRTSTDAEQSRSDLVAAVRAMWFGPVLAICLTGVIVQIRPTALAASLPLLALWGMSPVLAWWLSRTLRGREAKLRPEDTAFLEEVARKTWYFFETFVTPEDNWLPPDNFQEYPVAVIAHRTSPTNMGLSLLANLGAYDFGFVSTGQLATRCANSLQAMERLERFRGHFLNWYDTRTLEPLHPRYISTVDSGNLVGHLLTLQVGLAQLADRPILPPQAFKAIRITWRRLMAAVQHHRTAPQAGVAATNAAESSLAQLQKLQEELAQLPAGLGAGTRWLASVTGGAPTIAELAQHADDSVRCWALAIQSQSQAWIDDINLLSPLATLPPAPRSIKQTDAPEPAEALRKIESALNNLDGPVTLRRIAQLNLELSEVIAEAVAAVAPGELRDWLVQFQQRVVDVSNNASARIASHEALARTCLEMSDAEFDFLFDKARQLLAIGFNVSERRRDASFYDLLASEARLASFVAIAQGQLQQEHWFALGRMLTGASNELTLLSWSGSMFEYLMPQLVMPSFEGTLLDQTCKAAVARQIAYGATRKVPWGISESGYNVTDAQLNYQYRAFGVPGLGFKRGLVDDLVVAPYATQMALMVAPKAACANLRRMSSQGFEGKYGYYEAIDYTPARLTRGQTFAVVRSFMAHHQGMGFLSLAYVLLDQPMQQRFGIYPLFQATELLLQERIPLALPVFPHSAEGDQASRPSVETEVQTRLYTTPNTPIPEVHLLSNGSYHVMVTNSGGGYSRWKDLAVTRWREDVARDDAGTFCYLRDVTSNELWSAGFQPTLRPSATYEAIFPQSRAEFRRRDAELDTHTEIAVSPEDDVELRRISITNRSRSPRTVELTSYAEVVLASPAADATHPAFSNLFVQTEIVRNRDTILCTRRPRSHKEHPPWMVHLMSVHGELVGETSYETDRAQFLGRGHSVADPQSIGSGKRLSNSEGSVLDPIVAIRSTIVIQPEATAVVDIVTGISEARDGALTLAGKYHDRHLADRLLDLAWTHGQVILQQLSVSESEAQLYGRLASSIIYASGSRRATSGILNRNFRGQSGLWGHGISGDLPIVLLRIADQTKLSLVRQLIKAHAYWRFKGLAVDLVIWNEDQSGYRQYLQDEILSFIADSTEAQLIDRPGGIFVRRPEQMSEEDRVLLQSVARVVLIDSAGVLADQIERRGRRESTAAAFAPVRLSKAEVMPAPVLAQRELVYSNGVGGFTPDGREYVITTRAEQRTPAPWVNVLANPKFGTVVTESGGGYTWLENAHEHRLTPWYNDPVTDRCGELLYLRDEESGALWSPTPLPAAGKNAYVTRHGFGYTIFETMDQGIASELTVYVAMDGPAKFFSLKLYNASTRTRRLSATCYMEWVLAESRPKSLMHIVTEVDPKTGALLARNPYNTEAPGWVAFLDVNEPQRSITGDRTEFFGRNGTPANPAAMSRTRLSGKVGPGLDPCGAMQATFEIPAGQHREIVFTLGATTSLEEARNVIQRFRGMPGAKRALEGVWRYWQHALGAVHIDTPDPGINILANGWLLYQTLSCRLWGRSGFYQSGGAFGFRDQLQDVMALMHAEPGLAREHLLRAAAHQFIEGDVQHWWHPPNGQGVRTHFSDDFLWLPLVTSRYVKQIGDTGVLDEPVTFLQGRLLKPEEESYYDMPSRSDQSATLYEHCVRAIKNGLRFGSHGLPLIGCGDWNDGMNLVGEEGRGESVWLAFFLVHILQEFSPIAAQRGDADFVEQCRTQVEELKRNIESNAWDGGWYRRAYFDNGEPLGSAMNSECQIDSIPQSWSVLSAAGDPKRARQSMEAVHQRLVRSEYSLIQLFDPPFDKSPLDPGYIKGYVPGVRENGGQYTHAAIWTIMAFAALGDERRVWELLSLINPLSHGSTPGDIAIYKVEPYVVAADVYAVAPHIGRGGWTWYTGSAGWMYQLLIESLLGLHLEVNRLRFTPCIPAHWPSFKLHYRYRDTFYHVVVNNNGGHNVTHVALDGTTQADRTIPLVNDRQDHSAVITLG